MKQRGASIHESFLCQRSHVSIASKTNKFMQVSDFLPSDFADFQAIPGHNVSLYDNQCPGAHGGLEKWGYS